MSCQLATMSHAISWYDVGNSESKLWDDNGNWSFDRDGDSDRVGYYAGHRQLGSSAGPLSVLDAWAMPEPSTLLRTCLAASCGLHMPRQESQNAMPHLQRQHG